MQSILKYGGIALCVLACGSWNSQAQDSAKVDVKLLTRTGSSWDGQSLPSYPKGTPEITILRITIPPKMKLPVHEHPVINAGVLLKGQLTVVKKDGETLHLKAGDSIVEVVDKWHYGMNQGNEPAEIIVFYAGTTDSQITVKEPGK
jgi:quercetin dioxygenase-like cupin family protein